MRCHTRTERSSTTACRAGRNSAPRFRHSPDQPDALDTPTAEGALQRLPRIKRNAGVLLMSGIEEERGSPTADARIRQAKHDWESTIDALAQVVCLLDAEGRIVRANRAVERWGLGGVVAARGVSLHRLLHPACSTPGCWLAAALVDADGSLRRGSGYSVEADDAILHRRIAVQWRPVTPNSGADPAGCTVAFVEDVTEAHRLQSQLRSGYNALEQQVSARTRELIETNARLRREVEERRTAEEWQRRYADEVQDLYNRAPCGYHSLDEDGVIVRINDTELAWLGYARDDVVGRMHFADLLTPAGRDVFARSFAAFKQTGSASNVEYDLVCRDGSRFPVALSATAVTDEQGRFVMSRSTLWDIGAHRRMAQALRKSEESYRRLVDTMIEGLVVYDLDGRIVYVNESLCNILGFTRAELVGRPAAELLCGVRQCSVDELCTQHMVCPCGRYEASWTRKDGGRITVLVSPQRLDGPGGEFLGCFAVVMDISDRKLAEEALSRSESDLRLLSAQLLTAQEVERKRIASELHDSIGQTLSALKFQLENAAAAAGEGSRAVGDLVNWIVPRVQGAVEEVRRISMDLRPSILDDLGVLPTLAWFFREFRDVYRHHALETRLAVREEDVPENLKTAIYRIVQEAVNNVVRHAQARTLTIDLSNGEGLLYLGVRDDGIGLGPSPADRDAARRGLGMSTMRERAEITGGRFQIESVPGRGTAIHVFWPCPTGLSS